MAPVFFLKLHPPQRSQRPVAFLCVLRVLGCQGSNILDPRQKLFVWHTVKKGLNLVQSGSRRFNLALFRKVNIAPSPAWKFQ